MLSSDRDALTSSTSSRGYPTFFSDWEIAPGAGVSEVTPRKIIDQKTPEITRIFVVVLHSFSHVNNTGS